MKIHHFTYTGTGSGFSLTGFGLGGVPDIVIIKGGANHAVFRTSVITGDKTAYFANAVANFAGGITSLDSDGITLGTHVTVNASGTVYYGIAIKDDGAGDVAVGSYSGNGTSQNITDGFQANFIATKADGTTAGCFRTSDMTGTNSALWSTNALLSGRITALGATTFSVGSGAQANTNGSTYYWFALKSAAGIFGVFTYAGNATDDRDITIPVQPGWVSIKGDTTEVAVFRSIFQSGDDTCLYPNVANQSNNIQVFGNNLINLGTDARVNANAINYYGWVFWNTFVYNPIGSQLTFQPEMPIH